ncbi:MAG: ABC transporter ATP-binding protein [Rhodobacteraceae bacterium]|nr:ABC transporter ATP-binding protein [Paracoccaceae bacterium]
MPSTAIEIQNLTIQYGSFRPLDDVSLTIEAGEFLTLLGPSGCGKSTTMRCIAGLQEKTSGEILFDGVSVEGVSAHKRDVGFVFQNWALFPHLSVIENIEFGLKLRGVAKAKMRERALEALAQVQLAGYEDRKPAQLSGGQQQRVALARAIVIRPGILMFDEPLSNLDAKLRKEMRIELKRLRDHLKITSIYVTHDQQEALTLSDRIALLYKGRIQQLGPPAELYNRPRNRFVAEFMGYENFIPVEVVAATDESVAVKSAFGAHDFARHENMPDYAPGQKAQIAARASSTALNEGRSATIRDFLYYGDTTCYYLDSAGAPEGLQATREGLPEFEIGGAVGLAWGTGGVALVPEGQGGSGSVVGTAGGAQ